MKNKTLKLVLKYKWYDMIESGIKKEEYREIKKHNISLICEKLPLTVISGGDLIDNHSGVNYSIKKFNYVQFFRGYSKHRKTMIFKLDSVIIGKCRREWSEGGNDDVFVIKLGERIIPVNHCHIPENASCKTKKMLNRLVNRAYTTK